ncbi:MAG TPA: cyclic nucleotide-binding domain-containing protein [Polyangiales bacterium]|nr:cyclic nucleotide-binding domain-containing protein [Polyangiales bacterium]
MKGSGSSSDRPTDSEYGGEAEPAERRDRESGPGTTVRASAEEHSTLRLGTSAAGLGNEPPWRSRYEDLGEIARGGMSVIRDMFDRVIRRHVAMKILDRERDPAGLTQFIEEARITAQLDHPNIVPVHDVQYDELGLPTRFTMKLIEGETLSTALERLGEGALAGPELERLIGVVLKVCDAVSFAHSRGVIHCDLKPSNVLIGSHGQVYLTDWGVALRRDVSETDSGDRATRPFTQATLVGTPAYMAPEQAWGRREDIDERTDVYGLGGMLYALMTLRPPHDGGDVERDLALAKLGKVAAPETIAPGRSLPPGLCAIALRALSASPAQRQPSVEILSGQLQEFLRGGGWLEQLSLPKGTVVLQEGDVPDAAYILREGECELYRTVEGHPRLVRLFGAGEVFGEASIFGSSTRTATIVAASDVKLVRVTRDALERELERSEWLRAFVRALAERFIEQDRQLRKLDANKT